MCIYHPDLPPIIKKAFKDMAECIKQSSKPVADYAVEYVKSIFRKENTNGKAGKDQTPA